MVYILIFSLQPSLNLDGEPNQNLSCKTVITMFESISFLNSNRLAAAVVNHI